MKTYSLDQLKDKHLGKAGAEKRDKYEHELRLDLLGEMIRKTPMERQITYTEPAEMPGVQKSQISIIERDAKKATIATILEVFNALKVKVNFNIELQGGEFK